MTARGSPSTAAWAGTVRTGSGGAHVTFRWGCLPLSVIAPENKDAPASDRDGEALRGTTLIWQFLVGGSPHSEASGRDFGLRYLLPLTVELPAVATPGFRCSADRVFLEPVSELPAPRTPVSRCVSRVHSSSALPLAPTVSNSLGPAARLLVPFIDFALLRRQYCRKPELCQHHGEYGTFSRVEAPRSRGGRVGNGNSGLGQPALLDMAAQGAE